MGILDRRKTTPLMMQRVDEDVVLAISTADVLDRLGTTEEVVPKGLIHMVAAAAPALGRLGETTSGRLVRLSKEAVELLAQNDAVPKNGLISGVVRDPKSGRFAGLLSFEKADLVTSVAVNGPALIGAISMQIQLARMERKLDEINDGVQYLIDHAHHEISARLYGAVKIIERVAAETADAGFVDDDAWDQLCEIADDVMELCKISSLHLAGLTRVLLSPDAGVARKVHALRGALDGRHAEFWLRARVVAEVALLRWERLYLIRKAWTSPDDLEAVMSRSRSEVVDRRRELESLHHALNLWIDRGTHSDKVLDRLRIVKRRRLEALIDRMPRMLDAYPRELAPDGRPALPLQ